MKILLVLAGIALCLALSAFFSAAEMTYSSCSRLRVENLVEEGDRRAKSALTVLDRFDDALSAILIGNNLVNIASSSLTSVFMILLLGSAAGERYAWVATAVITVLVIICGETIPKITAKKNANRFALSFAYAVRTLMVLLYLPVWLVGKLTGLILMPLKGTQPSEDPDEAVEELQNIIETAEDEAVLDEDRSELVRSAIDFSDVMASEVMTARVDLYSLDVDDPWSETLTKIENSPYSRLPVYEGSPDHIIGVLYLNRFLKALTESAQPDLRSELMPATYVYKTMAMCCFALRRCASTSGSFIVL